MRWHKIQFGKKVSTEVENEHFHMFTWQAPATVLTSCNNWPLDWTSLFTSHPEPRKLQERCGQTRTIQGDCRDSSSPGPVLSPLARKSKTVRLKAWCRQAVSQAAACLFRVSPSSASPMTVLLGLSLLPSFHTSLAPVLCIWAATWQYSQNKGVRDQHTSGNLQIRVVQQQATK